MEITLIILFVLRRIYKFIYIILADSYLTVEQNWLNLDTCNYCLFDYSNFDIDECETLEKVPRVSTLPFIAG